MLPGKRGRPVSLTEGAAEAHDEIVAFMEARGFKPASFARAFAMTPSTVGRALPGRERASWTPAFRKIYCIAKNKAGVTSTASLERLAAYSGPGEAAVKRILADVDELVRTLSANEANT